MQHGRKSELNRLETELERAAEKAQIINRFLRIAARQAEMMPLLAEFVTEIRNLTGCSAVGFRILSDKGKIPYQAYEGFSRDFYESENSLSVSSPQCMCAEVIKGLSNLKRPFHKHGGSFYLNGTSRFLATLSKEETEQTCCVCNRFGYESVALVPIRLKDRILGLIHVADQRENMVPLEMVETLEGVGMQLGSAIQRVRAEEGLRQAHDQLEEKVKERTAELVAVNEQMRRQIEERKRAEKALRESEKQYRTLVETMNDGLAVQNENGVITYVNERLCEMMGYSRDEMIGQLAASFSDKTNLGILKEQMAKRRQGIDEPYEISWTGKGGQQVFTIVSPKPFFDADGDFKGSFAVITDITERKQAEDELKRSETELKLLSSQLLTAEEDERKRIAGELHDGIGQTLVSAKYALEKKLKQMGEGPPPAGLSVEEIVSIIRNGIEEVRTISMNLRPAALDSLGILATINWFCSEFENIHSGIRVEKLVDIREDEVPGPLKIVLYRILQEAMNNVTKHSSADVVRLSLRKTGDAIELVIDDNGEGFDLNEVLSAEKAPRGFGISSMRRRVELSGGALSVESAKGKGTTVRATWKQ